MLMAAAVSAWFRRYSEVILEIQSVCGQDTLSRQVGLLKQRLHVDQKFADGHWVLLEDFLEESASGVVAVAVKRQPEDFDIEAVVYCRALRRNIRKCSPPEVGDFT
jgi:hypothetical protein